jgi:hypothetical protein
MSDFDQWMRDYRNKLGGNNEIKVVGCDWWTHKE